mmetsp:Transcript_13215/g.33001  ORF Transcript_13215/g.33001 Transcript_13215/m.33001 type:complete len:200 (-) Transcript_13215:52-651(-)
MAASARASAAASSDFRRATVSLASWVSFAMFCSSCSLAFKAATLGQELGTMFPEILYPSLIADSRARLVRGATNVAAESLMVPFDFFCGGIDGSLPSLKVFTTPQGSKLVRGTPITASWTAASRSCLSEDESLEALTDTVHTSSPGNIFSTNFARVERGPNSTNTRAPSRCIARICSIQRTEDTMCLLSRFAVAAASPL